jgi:S1-C subfamily serine protease
MTPDLAESFGLDSATGIIIAGVLRGGPADRGGIEPGDIVTEVAGTPIDDPARALNLIVRLTPGERVVLKGWHQQEPAEWTVEVDERPQNGTR